MDESIVITVSTGVQFHLKQPNLWLLMTLLKQLDKEEPLVPMIDREDGRQEENPTSPTYQAALAMHRAHKSERMYELAIASGTEIGELPEGFSGVDDKEWEEVPRLIGIEIATDRLPRYIQWVKYNACPAPSDIKLLLEPVLQLMGIKEEEVDEALGRFPGDQVRTGNNRAGDQPSRRHGHKTKPPASRSRTIV